LLPLPFSPVKFPISNLQLFWLRSLSLAGVQFRAET
jgi:hypothetical protein